MKHQWKSQRMGGSPADVEAYEIICYCAVCGAEYSEDDNLPLCSEGIIPEDGDWIIEDAGGAR